MIDPYMYVKCRKCENIFRVVKSGAGRGLFDGSPSKTVYLLECPRCGLRECDRTTKREWTESNEVRPNNV